MIAMKIKTGNTRRVFVFKNVVVKVARIYWLRALNNMIFSLTLELKGIKRDGIKNYFRWKKEIGVTEKKEIKDFVIEKEKLMQMKIIVPKFYEMNGTVAMRLFGGIMANYQEWRFYRKTKNIFVMPTYFSLFWLLNIQKKGKEIDFWNGTQIYHYMYNNSQNHYQPFCDMHVLTEKENFCLDNGHLRIVDYGSRRIGPFLEINGEKFYNNFELPD